MVVSNGLSTGFAGYENRIVLILTLAGGVAALDAQAVFFLMPFIVKELKLDNTHVGLIGSAVLLSWSIAALLVGLLSDRLRQRKPFLVGAFVCFAVFSTASAFAGSFLMLLLARLLIGTAEGPVIPLTQSIMLAESSPHRRGLNMGIVQNFGAQLVGTLLAPILLVSIAATHGWRAAFLLAGIPGLIVAFLIARFVREPAALVGAGSRHKVESLGAMMRAILREHNVRLCILIATCSVAWFFMLLTFLPLWLTEGLGFSSTSMGLVMATIGAAGAISAIVVPGLSDRIGRKNAISLFAAVGLLAPLGALTLSNAALIGAALFVGCLMLGTFPLFMGTVPLEAVRSEHSATAAAIVIGSGQICGGIFGPALGGVAADLYGLEAPLLIAGGLAVISALASLGLRAPSQHAVAGEQPKDATKETWP